MLKYQERQGGNVSLNDPAEQQAERVEVNMLKGTVADEQDYARPVEHIESNNFVKDRIAQEIGRGRGMDAVTLEEMNAHFGEDFAEVGIHTDFVANLMCKILGCYSFTYGNDIFFDKDRYMPATQEGKALLAHELTHVLQQRGEEAKVQKFEAPLHESSERLALSRLGFSQEEITQIYFGNWMRDMNQILVPAITDYDITPDTVMGLISYLAFKKFGKEVTAEQFGYYIPAEHMDNPAGQLPDQDFFKNPPETELDSGVSTMKSSKLPSELRDQDISETVGGVNRFSVDTSGVMAFIRKTNVIVEKRLELAAIKGRTPEGRMHFGAAMHAVEDLFAHSNYVEIALTTLLQKNPTLLPNLKGEDRKVTTLSPEVTIGDSKRRVLTTGTFASMDTMVSVGSEAVKMMRAGLATNVTEEDSKRAGKLTQMLLDNFYVKLEKDPNFKSQLETDMNTFVKENNLTFFGVNIITPMFNQPVNEYYRWLTELTAWIPGLPLYMITNFFNGIINKYVLLPMSDQVEAMVAETLVQNTTIAKNLEAQKLTEKSSGSKPAESFLGVTITEGVTAEQALENKKNARKNINNMEKLPKQVLATGSHSQLAKDHTNSLFFGLSFMLAAKADEMLARRMLRTQKWNKVSEIQDDYRGEISKATVAEIEDYNDEKRKDILLKSGMPLSKIENLSDDQQVEAIVQHQQIVIADNHAFKRSKFIEKHGVGGEEEESEDGKEIKFTKQQVDLEEQRRQASDSLLNVANFIAIVEMTPSKIKQSLTTMKSFLTTEEAKELLGGKILYERSLLYLDQSREGMEKVDVALQATGIAEVKNKFIEDANLVMKAETLAQREYAYEKLRADQSYYLNWVDAKMNSKELKEGSVKFKGHAAALLLLNRVIVSTAPSFTQKQLDDIDGEGLTPQQKIPVSKVDITRPNISSLPASIQELLKTSRKIINHPEESHWWEPTMRKYIREHPDETEEYIKARNSGYAVFRDLDEGFLH